MGSNSVTDVHDVRNDPIPDVRNDPMPGVRIDQLLPAAHLNDATGDAALHLARALSDAGFCAGLYALDRDPELEESVRPFDSFQPPGEDDVTVLHFTLSSPLSRVLDDCRSRRVIVYHNLTPPSMLVEYCPAIGRLTAVGRQQLQELSDADRIDLAIGVSDYNAADLRTSGFSRVITLPLPVNFDRLSVAPDSLMLERYADCSALFLTVGRVAPNKRLEDFLRIAAYYLRFVDPNARFVVAGSARGLEVYSDALIGLHARLGLDQRVELIGKVSLEELVALYRSATSYLCTSEHEGFCVPLLEAMYFEVPILARAAAAVPETLGDAGITFEDNNPAAAAEMLHLLATDQNLRQRLVVRGRRRLRAFDPATVTGRWIHTFRHLLERSR